MLHGRTYINQGLLVPVIEGVYDYLTAKLHRIRGSKAYLDLRGEAFLLVPCVHPGAVGRNVV